MSFWTYYKQHTAPKNQNITSRVQVVVLNKNNIQKTTEKSVPTYPDVSLNTLAVSEICNWLIWVVLFYTKALKIDLLRSKLAKRGNFPFPFSFVEIDTIGKFNLVFKKKITSSNYAWVLRRIEWSFRTDR